MHGSVRFGLAVVLLTMVLGSPASPSHSVGEPDLEKHRLWKQCCADRDCIPQKVKIFGREQAEKISVKIEGVYVIVDKDKLHPVPSRRTWVCYFNPNGKIANENIRCILFPEKGGTV